MEREISISSFNSLDIIFYLNYSQRGAWLIDRTMDIVNKYLHKNLNQNRHILKTVKNSTDRPPVHTITAHFLPADFENGRF